MKKTTRLKKPQVPKLGDLLYFDDLNDRPKYAGQEMTSETSIPSFQLIMDETHSAVIAEADARTDADRNLQSQIDTIIASSDVKDIVGTYADLEAYDTSTLGDNDIIKVLADETHDDAIAYYRWHTSSETWTYIGEMGPFYTENQVDTLLGSKQNLLSAGDNITISAENEISATDTTYSNFVGTDGTAAGSAGLVPAPTASDAGKVLGASGNWETPSGGGGSDIIELTSADYNYHKTGEVDDGIAPWLLTKAGIYNVKANTAVYWSGSASVGTYDYLIYVWKMTGYTTVLRQSSFGMLVYYGYNGTGGESLQPIRAASNTVLRGSMVDDTLTSTYQYAPLSARQGKALNDKIEAMALTNSEFNNLWENA